MDLCTQYAINADANLVKTSAKIYIFGSVSLEFWFDISLFDNGTNSLSKPVRSVPTSVQRVSQSPVASR